MILLKGTCYIKTVAKFIKIPVEVVLSLSVYSNQPPGGNQDDSASHIGMLSIFTYSLWAPVRADYIIAVYKDIRIWQQPIHHLYHFITLHRWPVYHRADSQSQTTFTLIFNLMSTITLTPLCMSLGCGGGGPEYPEKKHTELGFKPGSFLHVRRHCQTTAFTGMWLLLPFDSVCLKVSEPAVDSIIFTV